MVNSVKRLRARIASPPDPFLVTPRSLKRVCALIEAAGPGATILNVGAGYTSLGERVVNIDIFDSGTTDVIASAMALPFPDNSADLVILQGVLEHVEDAAGTLPEAIRVLKPG